MKEARRLRHGIYFIDVDLTIWLAMTHEFSIIGTDVRANVAMFILDAPVKGWES